MKLINTDLLLNPLNWFVVITMILFSLFLMALISPQSGGANGSPQGE